MGAQLSGLYRVNDIYVHTVYVCVYVAVHDKKKESGRGRMHLISLVSAGAWCSDQMLAVVLRYKAKVGEHESFFISAF